MAFNIYNPQGYFNPAPTMTPNGSVFMVNNSYEAANAPIVAGTTVAISLNDNLMYIKSSTNGVMAYKLTPYTEPQRPQQNAPVAAGGDLEKRMAAMEQQISILIDSLNGQKKGGKDKEPIPWDV